jgi:hypothetical protein
LRAENGRLRSDFDQKAAALVRMFDRFEMAVADLAAEKHAHEATRKELEAMRTGIADLHARLKR